MTTGRILLTGGAGFIGSHLVKRWAAQGWAVTVLSRAPEANPRLSTLPGVTLVRGDVRDAALLAAILPGHRVLVHHALVWGDPEDDVALEDTRAGAKLVDLAGRAGVETVLYTSSTAVHRPFSSRMDEDSPLRPNDLYGATKAAGELVLGAIAAQAGQRFGVLRLAPVIGPPAFDGAPFRCDPRFFALARAARAGEDLVVRDGEGRQFVSVTDVAEAYAAVLASDIAPRTYVVASAEVTPWAEVGHALVAAAGGRVVEVGPPVVAERFDVARLERGLGLRFDARPALPEHLAHVLGSLPA